MPNNVLLPFTVVSLFSVASVYGKGVLDEELDYGAFGDWLVQKGLCLENRKEILGMVKWRAPEISSKIEMYLNK